jgi:uncharacterized protein
MTFSPDRGGVFDTLARLARYGLGGTAGDGRQFISWVHERDFVDAVHWLILHDGLTGAVNIASPNPLPNAQFMQVLRQACDAPIGLRPSGWMLELGAFLMRTATELILKSRRVVPARLLEHGYRFQYPSGLRLHAICAADGVRQVPPLHNRCGHDRLTQRSVCE